VVSVRQTSLPRNRKGPRANCPKPSLRPFGPVRVPLRELCRDWSAGADPSRFCGDLSISARSACLGRPWLRISPCGGLHRFRPLDGWPSLSDPFGSRFVSVRLSLHQLSKLFRASSLRTACPGRPWLQSPPRGVLHRFRPLDGWLLQFGPLRIRFCRSWPKPPPTLQALSSFEFANGPPRSTLAPKISLRRPSSLPAIGWLAIAFGSLRIRFRRSWPKPPPTLQTLAGSKFASNYLRSRSARLGALRIPSAFPHRWKSFALLRSFRGTTRLYIAFAPVAIDCGKELKVGDKFLKIEPNSPSGIPAIYAWTISLVEND